MHGRPYRWIVKMKLWVSYRYLGVVRLSRGCHEFSATVSTREFTRFFGILDVRALNILRCCPGEVERNGRATSYWKDVNT